MDKSKWVYVRKRMYQSRYLYLLLFIPIIYFLVFKYWPIYGVQIAFRDYKVRDGIWGSHWVGLEHFKNFISDPDFINAFKNTIILSGLSIFICFPIPIIFALVVNEIKLSKLKRIVESISCFPHFISTVIVVSVLISFVSVDGIVNQIIVFFGGQAKSFMLDPNWFRPLYILSDIWQGTGWSAIIYIAALSGVDPQLYEACGIDGGGRLTNLWHISLPSIAPTIVIMFILRMGAIMSVSFEKVLLMQSPTIYDTADVISTYVYRRGIQGAQYSYATAVGIFESLIGLTFLLIANQISKKLSETSLF